MNIGRGGWQHHRHRRCQSSVPIIRGLRIVVRVAGAMTTDQSSEGLRPRRCCDPTCNAMFAVCRSCDRGQRYCSDACKKRMRRRQLAAAGRRYQATAAGKQAHCCRQRAYRQRRSLACVTHQGPVSITTPRPSAGGCLTQCAVCGQPSRWINPFYWLPVRRRGPRRGHRSARVQISTFSRDG